MLAEKLSSGTCVSLFVLALSGAAGAQSTTRVSVDSTGGQANDISTRSSISRDGRFVTFLSDASNLVAGDTNGRSDVFVHDRLINQTTRVSVDSAGGQVIGGVYSGNDSPVISPNGGVVAFSSVATNLVPGDTNGCADVFVHDLMTGATTLVSVGSNGDSCSPAASFDGRFVAFVSYATNLGTGIAVPRVYVRDRLTGQTNQVSVSSAGVPGNGRSGTFGTAISANGQRVVFSSDATNLVPFDTNGCTDVFAHDLTTGITERVSVSSIGGQGTGNSPNLNAAIRPVSISEDGRYVAYQSDAGNLIPTDSNGAGDVFVHDCITGITVCGSVTPWGMAGNGNSESPSLSADGRYVAFASEASNLVAGDTNASWDVFIRDLQGAQTTRVSLSDLGGQSIGSSSWPSVSALGRLVAFDGGGNDLVPGDTCCNDIFLRDWFLSCYLDGDGDAFGIGGVVSHEPVCPPGLAPNDLDCDDSNASIHPGAPELCNGLDDNCDGVFDEGFLHAYCTSGTTVHGCVPTISGTGAPSSTASNGFEVVVSSVPGDQMGTLFYGFYQVAIPWAPGSLSYRCVAFPVQRTGNMYTGGTLGQCNGELRQDWNTYISTHPGVLGSPFNAGQTVYVQGWFRDPGAPKQTNMSNALRFVLCN